MGSLEKRLRRERQRKRGSRNRAVESGPDRFSVAYASPDVLLHTGPLVVATWSVPESLEKALINAGKPVPDPVSGHMLVDTGATRTSIAKEVAEKQLGLRPTSVARTYGAGGLHENPCYLARFQLEIMDGSRGHATGIARESVVMGIPELGNHPTAAEFHGKPIRLIGLLGRDFLRHATLTYDGDAGRIEMRLHLHSIPKGKPRS